MLDAEVKEDSMDFFSMFDPRRTAPEPPAPDPAAPCLPAIPNMDMAAAILEPFRNEAIRLEAGAANLTVNDEAAQAQAVSFAGSIKKLIRKIEDARKEYVGPFNAHVKEVNALAGEIRFPLERGEKELKKKLNSFAAQLELQRRKAEEEARRQAAMEQERLNQEAAEAGVEAPIVPEIVDPEEPSAVKTAAGTAFMQSRWTFELDNLADVPAEYLMLDEKKVRAAIKAGIRHIPGLKIFEQKNIAIRS